MKVSPKQLSAMIAQIYDAALQPELWSDFLRDVTDLTRGDSAALMIHDSRDQLHNVYQQANVSPKALDDYQKHYGRLDVWSARGEHIKNTTWLGTSEMLCPDKELRQTEYFNDFLLKHRISHALFAFIERTPTRVVNLSVYRDEKAGEFPEWGIEIMSLLQPHLKRALSLRSHLMVTEQRSKSFVFAADKSSQNILFLSSDGKIVFANKGALAILDTNDGLTIQRNRLRANNQRENALLDKLIREAAATAHGCKFGAGGCVSISRKAGPHLQLVIMPLPMRISVTEGSAIVLFFIDPLNHVASRNELLQSAFGLTKAEAKVACMVAHGFSIEEIANELSVTRNTLKTQLASIYSKTGIRRQNQLSSLVLQFPNTD